ncbi:unnamed protein product, partial [Didymodactylos carnosus]
KTNLTNNLEKLQEKAAALKDLEQTIRDDQKYGKKNK